MDTVEVVDDTVLPWVDDGEGYISNRWLRYCRPLLTEADLVAAAAPAGDIEIRYMIQDLPDDPGEVRHVSGSCSVCTPGSDEYVLDQKQIYAEEMAYYDVRWDPTITF